MRRFVTILYVLLLSAFPCYAMAEALDENDQLLIFRNTGEVNLLFQSKVDSIIMSTVDSSGVVYDEPVSQIFYTADTVLSVPIAEIDSVCFGSRNVMELRDEVRELSNETDIKWIIRFDGSSIYYRKDTPESVLPKVGMKLFYSEVTDLFPYGLTAKVVSVNHKAEEIEVQIENVELDEIFDKFFFAGNVSYTEEQPSQVNRRKGFELGQIGAVTNLSVDLGEYGTYSTYGEATLSGTVVLHPLDHYYTADLTLSAETGFDFNMKSEDSGSVNVESKGINMPLWTVLKILNISLKTNGFVDLDAELKFDYNMKRRSSFRIEWTRKDGVNTLVPKDPSGDDPDVNEAKIDLTLDGRVYAGVMFTLDFSLIGETSGARAKVKFGPEITGKVNLQLINDLSKEYDVKAYGSAKFSGCLLLDVGGYLYHKEHIIFGDEVETRFFERQIPFLKHEIELFPQYCKTKAIGQTSKQPNKEKIVSASTKIEEPIAHDLTTGFQLVDENDEVLDSVFVEEPIMANCDEVQGVSAEIPMPKSEEKTLYLRPVFHYAGYTIPFAKTAVDSDANIEPVISYITNGNATILSGIPIVDTNLVDSTAYHVGPYLPVEYRDSVFINPPEEKNYTHYISSQKANDLVNTWVGDVDGIEVKLILNEDHTAVIAEEGVESNYRYLLNEPQIGNIMLVPEKDGEDAIILNIRSFEPPMMRICFTNRYDESKTYQFKALY